MITIGLAGWGDHEELYRGGVRQQDKLKHYNKHFQLVEVDSSYYAIHKESLYEKWAADTTASFSFIIKAYQGLTGQTRQKYSQEETRGMFTDFRQSIRPVVEAGKLKAVLFQYPPWFDCTKANVDVIREAKARMGDIPVALEFRHQSWFREDMREKTLSFMRREGWIHSVCDEPQAGVGSVPIVLEATHPELTMVRFHGRNVSGWVNNGEANWRDVRYLYNYSQSELLAWKAMLLGLQEQSREICVIFNNNSGGHATGNAREMMAMLGIAI